MLGWLGIKPGDPAEKAARKVAKVEGAAKVKAAKLAAKPPRKYSIEKMIIAVTDVAYLTALLGACFVAYMLDAIFFFQQTTLIWLSLLLCLFGLVIRTVAITGGVVLQSAEEDEIKATQTEENAKRILVMRWLHHVGRVLNRFSLARTTMRTVTIFCWIACAFASLSFFASGQEMRNFAQENISKLETVQVDSKEARIERLKADKLTITTQYVGLINGARQSMNLVLDDGNKTNDDVSTYEKNIKGYDDAMKAELAAKDVDISALEQSKEDAQVGAQGARSETPPFLAVYVFLAGITGMVTGSITTWVSIFFALVLELLVDTGLQNYFGMKKKHAKRLRAIEARELLEDAEWRINRFNMEAHANLAFGRARSLAAESQAAQDLENAELEIRVQAAQAKAAAARAGTPWVDPAIERTAAERKAAAEADLRIAAIEADIREIAAKGDALRNPPKPVEAPPKPDWRLEVGEDGLNHYQRMQKKSQDSKNFDKDEEIILNGLKVPTQDWRTRFDV